jgi:hypothetical protein
MSAAIPTTAGLGRYGDAYLERCRIARLRRWSGRMGAEALKLQRGDLYAWREGLPPAPGAARISLLAEPRTLLIATDRIWWVPRLEQLLELLEQREQRRAPGLSTHQVRGRVALQLADQVHAREETWEEAALSLLQAPPA